MLLDLDVYIHDCREILRKYSKECVYTIFLHTDVRINISCISLKAVGLPSALRVKLTVHKRTCHFENTGSRLRAEYKQHRAWKIAVFWVVAPCSLVEVYQRFTGPCCLHHQGDE
jgi:hypothetical protein